MTDPQDILREGIETFEDKNEDYGDSWRLAGHALHEMADGPVTLETPEDWIRVGLYTRRMDKLIRALQGEFHGEEPNFEDITDSHEDESVYAAMHASLDQ